jgi:MraZ protein
MGASGGAMTQFLGTHTSKLDRKGRVSVPALFRAALERLGTDELIFRPSHRAPCIEAYARPDFERMTAGLERLDLFSDARDDLAFALFAEALPARPDAEGRLVLPEEMVAHAGLTDAVAFVGKGRLFELWEPAAAKRQVEEARARARGLTLPAAPVAAAAAAGGGT